MRTFLYSRVSTTDQTTDNQRVTIEQAGYQIPSYRIIEETVSGGVPAAQRAGFATLLNRLEPGDELIVVKLDRLGRDTIDVIGTVNSLSARGVRVKCLALGNVDLTSPAGQMILTVLSAIAQFERDLIKERTTAGLARARAAGKRFGRPPSPAYRHAAEIRAKASAGCPIRQLQREYKTHGNTIRDIIRQG